MSKITIDAGIEVLSFDEPSNLKLKMLMDSLKDHIEIYGLDKLTAFFDGENVEELKVKIAELESDVKEKDEEIDELESELSESELGLKIDCGIGDIEYIQPNNIALQDIMENLDAAIQKTNFKKVNEVLAAI
jgi:predicted RNase H-like nuclease (RuvC/YqgF family)